MRCIFWCQWLVPRYTIIKIFKNFVPAIFVIFLIVYSRIRHALTLWRIQPPHPSKIKTPPFGGIFISGGSGWIRTSSGLSQQIYSLPRLSNSGARPILGAGSGNRTRISSLEGLHTSLCTMPATNSKLYDYILL